MSHDTCHAASREVMMNVGGTPLGVYRLSRRVISDSRDPGNCLRLSDDAERPHPKSQIEF